MSNLLGYIGSFVFPATTTSFVAKDNFFLTFGNTKVKIKIGYISHNFAEWFLFDQGKIENQTSETIIRYHGLKKSLMDTAIVNELGGETKAETTLTIMFALMKKQSGGEKGVLLNNRCANIFYIVDCFGLLRAVHVYWRYDGWCIFADPVEEQGRRNITSRVFSQ